MGRVARVTINNDDDPRGSKHAIMAQLKRTCIRTVRTDSRHMAQSKDYLRVPPTNYRLRDCHQYEQWQVVKSSINSKWQQMAMFRVAPDRRSLSTIQSKMLIKNVL